jgi:hypothetical protein
MPRMLNGKTTGQAKQSTKLTNVVEMHHSPAAIVCS